LPAKGQTCATCAGDCCSNITFTGKYVSPLSGGILGLTVKELKDLGYEEVYNPHKPCLEKTIEGCLIYYDRPTICRSYYCHGRYWKLKTDNMQRE
jgi:hypothetical protein